MGEMMQQFITARILVFGDSIAYGAWDSEGGWVERLKRYAHTQTVKTQGDAKLQVINLGIGGDTSAAILARIESEITARYSPNWPFMFVLSVGTNDGREKDGTPEITADEYRQNLHRIFEILQTFTNDVIVLGLPPLGVAELTFKNTIYRDATIQQYDEILKEAATNHSAPYIDTRAHFAGKENLFAFDDLHPNDKGHELIASLIQRYLEAR